MACKITNWFCGFVVVVFSAASACSACAIPPCPRHKKRKRVGKQWWNFYCSSNLGTSDGKSVFGFAWIKSKRPRTNYLVGANLTPRVRVRGHRIEFIFRVTANDLRRFKGREWKLFVPIKSGGEWQKGFRIPLSRLLKKGFGTRKKRGKGFVTSISMLFVQKTSGKVSWRKLLRQASRVRCR